jgi:hypothetical protein
MKVVVNEVPGLKDVNELPALSLELLQDVRGVPAQHPHVVQSNIWEQILV